MNKITSVCLCLIFLSFSQAALSQIVINEVLSSNTNSATDEDGSHEDWVEIYNAGASTVNLNNFGLSDEVANPLKWKFPNVSIAPNAYMLIWCSDKNRIIPGSPLHTNWKISASGEAIYISNAAGIVLDNSPATAILVDLSYGRLPNGTGGFFFFEDTTPGTANGATGYSETLPPPTFSQNSAFLTSGFNLTLATSVPGATVIYTLDGSEPDENNLSGTTYNYKNSYPKLAGQPFGPMLFNTFTSQQYSAPIPISDRTPEPNKISLISSTYDFVADYTPTTDNIYKGNVVRAKVVKPGALPSKTITKNYFISPSGAGRFTLPVVSLSISENKLFDYDDGIYVAGKTFDDWRTANPGQNASNTIGNYDWKGSNYERVANFQYFENGLVKLNQEIGIRVQGNYSRIYPSKSLNMYSRSDYGTEGFAYKFFPDTPFNAYKNVVLKNSGSDFYNSFFKDALCAVMARPLKVQVEADQPVITFINGEYYGLLTMREKYDDDFFNLVYGIPKNEIELLENDGYYVEEGTNDHFLEMTEYFEDNSLVPQANFDYIKTQMDTESFIDYFITNIYMENGDWPGNNIIFWRRNVAFDPTAPYGNDGRWRWATHDMSSTWGDFSANTLAVATDPNGPESPNPEWSTLFLRRLLENPTFKYDFITRFADIMNTSFHPTRAVATINEMKAQVEPEMAEQIVRWKAPFEIDEWLYFVGERLDFAVARPISQRDHIRAEFGISNNVNATVNVSNAAHGYVHINTIDIIQGTPGITAANPYPWTGVYFSNIPVKLTAIAKPGYIFSHWTGASAATTADITITTSTNFSVTAVFIPSGFANEVSQPINFWMMNTSIPNDTPLLNLSSSYEVASNSVIDFQSSFDGYPFTPASPNWRKGSMERRNKPTPINYRLEANGNAPYVANDIRGLQITQPFQIGTRENTMIFNVSTVNYKNIKLNYAVIDEGAATGISVDYSVNSGASIWITTGLATTSLPLTSAYQLLETDFTTIPTVNNNPDFKVRLRFTGPNMTASNGARVTFNNIAVDAVRIPLTYPTPNIFTIGTAVNLSPTVTAAVTSYSISSVLPAGLSFDTTTGVISGTPSAPSAAATYTVTATNSGGSTTFDVLITVNDVAPSALSYNSPNIFTVGTAIADLNPTISGTVTNYSVSPSLPLGLVLDATTGVVSGAPTGITSTGIYSVTATNSGGSTSFDVTITVNDAAPSALSYNSPNTFTVGLAISSLSPTISGGTAVTYDVVPTLPAGLTLDAITGIISGTPTAISATGTFTVTATNSGGSTSFGIEITVNDASPSALSYNSPNVFIVGSTILDLNPTISGTVTTYSVSPSLPSGLSLDTTTGVISGTPTAISASGTYTVTASNSGGNISFGVVITVNDAAPSALSYNSPNVFTIGSTILNLNPTISGIVTPYSVSPSLPSGLSLNTTTGVISGTPTAISASGTYTVTATNSGGSTSFGVVITVNDAAPSALSYNSPNVFTVGSTILDLNPTISGTVTSYSVSPGLPSGLSLDTTTGVISGTPTAISASGTYTVTASNSGGNISFGVVITVNDAAPSALSYNSPNVFTIGSTILNLNPTISGIVTTYSISPSLPSGLSLNTTTGVISGTPTAISASGTYTVTASNSGGNISFGVVITVNDAAPSALSYNSPNVFTVGSTILDLNPTISGTVTSYSVSPGLPSGLSLDTTTGVISGTPTAISASGTYTVTATNSGGSTSFGIEITVNDASPSALSYNSPNVFTIGSTILNLNPTISGTVTSYSVSPGLPSGLSLDTTTGVISGTPTAISASGTYTVTATNSGGSTSFGVVITVNDAAPSALSYNSPNVFTVGSTILDLNPTISGTVTSYSVSPGLPSGLSLDTTTGVISGTPTAISASGTYTVTASNSGGNISFGVVITVNDAAPSALSYNSPNVFTIGSTILNLNPTISGIVTTYSISPSLPSGLSLNTTTGVISGTPTAISASGTYTVTASNSGGNISFGVVITVNDAAPSALSYNSPNVFTVGSTILDLNPTISGTVTSYSVSPGLPSGLSLDTTTGVISGTPTAISASGTYTVTATNSGGSTSFGIEITVNDASPSALSYNSPNVFTIGSTILNLNPTISGTVTSYSVSPSLPSGLSLDTTTGVISGTPTAISASGTYTVTATNSGGSTSFGVVITVNDAAPSALSYNSPNVFTVGSTILDLNPTISGTVTSYSVSPGLPSGLSLDTTTGVISGTPTAISASGTYTVTATNSGGSTSFGVVITVNDTSLSALSYNSPNVFTVGSTILNLNPTISGTVTGYSVSPGLPSGLTLDTTTGIISGTPTAISATGTYTVTASNSGGGSSFGIVITVNDAAPSSLSYNSPNIFTVGTPIADLNPTISGIVTSYSVSPSLPSGLTLDVVTGIISGTPNVVATALNYTVTATNSGGSTSFDVMITVNPEPPSGLSYSSPNIFTVGSAIAALNPTISGGAVSDYSISPALPSGLLFDTTTGVISGTPLTASPSTPYLVSAQNAGGSAVAVLFITVNNAAPSSLSYNSPNTFEVGSAITALNPTISGIVTTYSVSPSLPSGLSLNTTTGVISGTPTAISASGTYTVTATNSGGDTSFGVVITVTDAAPSALSYNSPNVFTVGSTILNLNPTISGTVTSYSVSPVLPSGLSLDTTTGVISGTPNLVATALSYTVTATNSGGSTSFDVMITVNPEPPSGLSYTSPNIFTVGSAIVALNPTISGGAVSNYSISPALPSGLLFDTTTGVISGTPLTASPSTPYLVSAQNAGGSAVAVLFITVNNAAPSALSYNSPNTFEVGSAITALNPTISGTVTTYSISPSLPSGLSLDTTTGIISGTPTAISASGTYTVTATNSGGDISFGVVITVNDASPSALSYNSPNVFTVGSTILNLNPTIFGTVTSYSVSPSLPSGLSLNTATGVISGTPNLVATALNYTVTATNSGGSTSFDVMITVNPEPPSGLSYTSPNIFTIGSAIVALNPTISGGAVSNYSISPALPSGLLFDTTTGVISGTPLTASPSTPYLVSAQNAGGSAVAVLFITVNNAAPSSLSYNSPNTFEVGSAITALNPTISGIVTTYSVSPSLPSGLSLNTTTGVISGTPTAISASGTYTVTATNSGGSTSFEVVITVTDAAPSALSYNSPNVFTVGSTILDLNPTISGIVTSYSVSPSLPSGLTLNSNTGSISGTPTTALGAAAYTVTATNSGGSISFDVLITVNDFPPAGLSYNSPNIFIVSTPIADLIPTVIGHISNYSIFPDLPAGLSFDTVTGIISGTPTMETATAIYTVTATNSGGTITFEVVITVDPLLGITENPEFNFEVYPNPFSDFVNVTEMNEDVDYKLYSVEGKLIQSGRITASRIDFRELPNGMYMLELSSGQRSAIKKIIKK